MEIYWNGATKIVSHSYSCGYCGHSLISELGYKGDISGSAGLRSYYIYICHFCECPTYIGRFGQVPSTKSGPNVSHITDDNVRSLYEEARNCMSVSAFTSAVICCRKLLMNIAVSKGDAPGKSFVDYINYLDAKGFIPPDGKPWIDSIRKLGNEANHSIEFKTQQEANLILSFTGMLLKIIFEMPGLLGLHIASNSI